MDFEDILKDVGGFGLYQKFLLLCLTPSCIIIPWLYVSNVFLTNTPDHWCYVPEVAHSNLSFDIQKALIRPPQDPSCSMYDANYSQILLSGNWTADLNWPIRECDSGWQFDKTNYDATATTRWNMVCKDAHYVILVLSLTFVGIVAGASIYGFMSDRLGRKPTFLILACLVAVSEIGSSLSPSFGLYLALRFVVGSTATTMYGVSYVILLEVVSPHIRSRVNFVATTLWTAGLCLLPLVAWLTRNWLYLSLAIAAAAACHLVYLKLLPESPSWLISQGRYAEAADVMVRISKRNGKSAHKGNQLFEKIQALGERNKKDKCENKQNSPLDFLRYPVLRKRFLLITACWIGNSIPYYGLQMNVRNLAGNEFLNFFTVSIVEVPAHVVTWLLIEKIGRRWCSISAFALTTGVCFMPILIPPGCKPVALVATLLAKITTSSAFMTLYQQGPELFPTTLRSVGMGMGCTIAVGSTFFVPYIVHLAEYGAYIPFLAFSAVTLIAGICAFFLPETLNKKLPQTIADVENSKGDPPFLSWTKKLRSDCDGPKANWTPTAFSPSDLNCSMKVMVSLSDYYLPKEELPPSSIHL